MERVIGVCSWSLRPESPRDLVERLRAVGLRHVQLALKPLRMGVWPLAETSERLAAAGIEIRSGMWQPLGEDYSSLAAIRATGGVRPDARWRENLAAAEKDATLAERLGMRLVTFHAGFLPHDRHDPERLVMLERLGQVADVFAARGCDVALETGQESAQTLLAVLQDLGRPGVGVNFDPANMILYGMGDPIEALERLGARVRQAHVKDALRARVPGEWGEEVAVGRGEVDWRRFCAALERARAGCDLMIEREAGEDRVADIGAARDLVRGLLA
ncbi:MAG: sugar phosphate isomerase/epimerase [Planctomycetes bacterium]|nr:sugar phosphate isomerase/epimerase [Planctomycetota bacterium]